MAGEKGQKGHPGNPGPPGEAVSMTIIDGGRFDFFGIMHRVTLDHQENKVPQEVKDHGYIVYIHDFQMRYTYYI